MKKTFASVAFSITILFFATSCASIPFFGRGAQEVPETVGQVPGLQVPVQRGPVLAILPFYGGVGEDGDIIATLFAQQQALLDNFTVLPRTAVFNDILRMYGAALTGLTDSDAIADIGRRLNAAYVLSGSIRRLGGENLLIATLVNVATLEQVAGYYQTYRVIGDVPGLLPSMSMGLVESALRRGTETRENLGIIPFRPGAGINREDAYTLTQILAIELINAGRFAILPRTSTIEAAIAEGAQEDADGMMMLGQALNAEMVLSGQIGSLGAANLFMANISRLDGVMITGESRTYQVITDGIRLMPDMAIYLTYPAGPQRDRLIAELREAERLRHEAILAAAEAERRRREAETAEQARLREAAEAEAMRAREEALVEARRMQEAAEAEARRAERAQAARARRVSATRTEREGFSLAYAWDRGGGENRAGICLGLILSGWYWSPLPYINLGIETRLTVLHPNLGNLFDPPAGYSFDFRDLGWYFAISPTIGAVVPLGAASRIFINAVFSMGLLPNVGMLYNTTIGSFDIGITPGLSAGFSFGRRTTFNLIYRLVMYDDSAFLHSAGFGIGRRI